MRGNKPRKTRFRLSWRTRKDAFGRLIWPLQFHKSAVFDSPGELGEFLAMALRFPGCPAAWEEKADLLGKQATDFCRQNGIKDKDGYFRADRLTVMERSEKPFYKIEIID